MYIICSLVDMFYCRGLAETARMTSDVRDLADKLAAELNASAHHSRHTPNHTPSPHHTPSHTNSNAHALSPSEEVIKYGELIVVG
jgi:hypothetical protein